MWLEFIFKPSTLFSLKSSIATNSAAKSLPVPSPYAVKMALLNAIITYDSLKTAKNYFPIIRDLDMRFSLSNRFVINNTMIRIFKENDKAKPDVKKLKPFKQTVAFREFVFLTNLKIAVLTKDNSYELSNADITFLIKWFMHINYFGKKGSFFQFETVHNIENLSDDYTKLLGEPVLSGIIFPLDDVIKDNNTTFENMSNFSAVKDAKRKSQIHVFPYQQISANKNFTVFQQIKNM